MTNQLNNFDQSYFISTIKGKTIIFTIQFLKLIFLLLMNFFVIIQILLSLAYVAHLVYIYSEKNVPNYVKFLVFVTWFLSFSIVFLLPLDIYNSIAIDKTFNHYYQTFLNIWKIVYWINFIFTWVLLPIVQEYQQAGQFDWKSKLNRSIINNLIIYGIFSLIGISFLFYLFIRGNFNNIQQLGSILFTASNIFGMILVVLLLSHGIVEIPKKLWRQKKYEMKLKYNQFNASVIKQEKQKISKQFEQKVKEILAHQIQNGKTLQNQKIINLIPENILKPLSKQTITYKPINLINHHKQIKKLLLDLNRLQTKWENLLIQTFRIQDIQKHMNSINHNIESTLFKRYNSPIFNQFVWFWYCRLKLVLIPILFFLLAIFACAVVLAQLSIFLTWISTLNIFTKVSNFQSFFLIDIYLLIPLFYISLCVFYGLFKMKFAGYYGLYKNHQTDAPSLIFTAINCSRVSTPLCYNFLQIINVKTSCFSVVMGSLDISPVFGRTFSLIFPLLLLILIIFNAFDVYSKLLKAFGLQRFQFQQNFNHQHIEDGRKILQKARVELENNILNSRNQNLAYYKSYQLDFFTKRFGSHAIDDERENFI